MAQHLPSEAPQTFDPQPFGTEDPETWFLLTSLTSGSSTIITATSRLEHLLKSHKIAFKAVDLATDAKAKRLWQWKGKGRRLPALVKDGVVMGNYEELEEWNEYGELKQNLGIKKKKKAKGMDGTPGASKAVKSAKPNAVAKEEPGSTDPTGGIPTAFAQAAAGGIAQAAAAVARKKATSGIKAAVGKQEGKSVVKKEEKKEEKKIEFVKPEEKKEDKPVEKSEAKEDEKVEVTEEAKPEVDPDVKKLVDKIAETETDAEPAAATKDDDVKKLVDKMAEVELVGKEEPVPAAAADTAPKLAATPKEAEKPADKKPAAVAKKTDVKSPQKKAAATAVAPKPPQKHQSHRQLKRPRKLLPLPRQRLPSRHRRPPKLQQR
ncbi:hypothetical protein EDC01DRAFT_45998 [Geopyxis carbonaria]|nr:hypothetical protein EDC01DRAFT_45998 [Geopyxis carbonaria]